jgi:hypothetical protein
MTLLVAFASGLVSCSNGDGSKILGHWRAERIKLMSLHIPIGPEFIITKHDLFALEANMHIPVASIVEDGNEFVLSLPAGFGLSFFFEGHDRMYVDVPLIGKMYYRRIVPASQAVRTIPAPAPAPALEAVLGLAAGVPVKSFQIDIASAPVPAPVSANFFASVAVSSSGTLDLVRQGVSKMNEGNLFEAEALLLEARELAGKHPMVEYNLAVLRLRQSDNDAAIRHLNDAFKYGFRAFGLLDADPDFAPLKSDVRYNALVSRYQ